MSALSFITIFETKSHRVKGVAFHPSRPWVLASLHNGVIQLWDYRIRTLVDRFGEHDGPVRAVDFHHSQPLFVSGGDDYKIKVWNYKERRCVFTLLGHLDYIRTVQFHHEYPWILSASDDQTIRIWNWQSRQCQAVLTGHSHYVMCARFHPSEDLVVSGSLDQTVRVWDISGLRKKNITPLHNRDDSLKLQNDLFGSTDAIVKFVLEGHDRGVNWAAFHPTSPLIVSGADDRQIKLWRMNDIKAWEIDTLRGHYNNVCCAIFHPREDILLSNSEDKTIRVWDMSKRTPIYTYRRDHDRFWMLAAHPKLNLFCAAHDSGFVVFKLHHDRPAYCQYRNEVLFYVKDRAVRSYHFESGRDTLLVSIRKSSGNGGGGPMTGINPRTLAYNNRENSVLVSYPTESGDRYELLSLPKDGKEVDSNGGKNSSSRGGSGRAAVWIKHNRFAVLDKSNVISIKDMNNEVTKKVTPPFAIDNMFAASTDLLLLRSDDRVVLYDVVQEKSTPYEAKIPFVKDAIWSRAREGVPPLVAFICRSGVVLASHKLDILFTIPETMKVKSGVWDDNGTFIYSTLSHIKYALSNGDHGIVRTLDRPIYITAARGNNTIFCLDRQAKCHQVTIDSTEFTFKHALANKRFDQVLRMVQNSNLIGQSIIGYLQRQGYPEVALHFVKDEKTRFNLALECTHMNNNIEIARQSAQALDDKECWTKLGTEALRQGNHQVVEKAYQKTLDFERLSFLYLITGNSKNLRKMLEIATTKRKDVNARFYNALLLGDVEERVNILEQQGQYPLAYACAVAHGLHEAADRIRRRLELEHEQSSSAQLQQNGDADNAIPEPFELPSFTNANPVLLFPPQAIFQLDKSNWPMTRMSRGPFDQVLEGVKAPGAPGKGTTEHPAPASLRNVVDSEDPGANWGNDDLDLSDDEGKKFKSAEESDGEKPGEAPPSGGWGEDDIEGLDDVEESQPTGAAEQSRGSKAVYVTLPPPGKSKPQVWARTSALAADLAAGGLFEEAMRLLNLQIGAVNFEPLRPHFMRTFQSASVQFHGLSSLPTLTTYIERATQVSSGNEDRDGDENSATVLLPKHSLTLQSQIDALSNAYKAVTRGPQAFEEAKNLFESILAALPMVVVQSRTEENEVKECIGICREYLLGIATEFKRKELGDEGEKENPRRCLELSAYFTHCDLQPKHLQLILKSAMNLAARLKNYKTADQFGRRLLDLNPPEDFVTHTRKVLRLCEQKGKSDALGELNYDPRNPFVLCGYSLTPIYQGSPSIPCPYCGTSFSPEFSGKLCSICHISQIGKQTDGGIRSFDSFTPQRGADRKSVV